MAGLGDTVVCDMHLDGFDWIVSGVVTEDNPTSEYVQVTLHPAHRKATAVVSVDVRRDAVAVAQEVEVMMR